MSLDDFKSGSFWETLSGSPRNRDEEKEKRLVDALYLRLNDKRASAQDLTALIAYFNARLYRLRSFLDGLADDCPLENPDDCPLKKKNRVSML